MYLVIMMDEKIFNNFRFKKAYIFAMKKHEGQKDDCGKDYFKSHVLPVSECLNVLTEEEDIIIAGLLHDTIEDTNATYEEIKEEFGERVADLVMEVTEESKNYFPRLKSPEAIMIKMIDRASNLSRMENWSEDRINYYLEKCRFWKKTKNEPNGADNYVPRPTFK